MIRAPWFWRFDIGATKRFNLVGRTNIEVRIDVLNLFDEDTVTSVLSAETRDVIAIGNDDFFDGFDVQALIAQQGSRRDPRFLQADGFQAPRTVRLLARLSF